ncbi:MAG: hypothetical protein EXS05_16580 [Planctomycetaceae bacterium]|nr:hypothetical protein [Planctomycetaceae bacterium]
MSESHPIKLRTLTSLLTVCLGLSIVVPGYGQEAVEVQLPPGVVAPPGVRTKGAPGQPPTAATPTDGSKPADGAPANPGDKKPDGPLKTTPRPQKSAIEPRPEELKQRLDDDGKVRFNFQGQPWLGVLEWLAEISQLSLDWQEYPSDFLNLRTQRSYTVDEARDLINRHLLDRGFTLIKHGEVLSVVNIKKLDPSLVPRVRPTDLDQREPHEFVKVSFPLDWLIAETAVEEFKPMLSPNGKLTALKSTNRIEAIDAVANLREIRDVLRDEQSGQGRKRLVREFKLEYVRAGDVLESLQGLLGLEKTPGAAPAGDPNQQAMQQQMMMQQRAQQQQNWQPPPPKPKVEVHLVVNQRENSVVAHAPADQMAVIAEAVTLLDVPSDKSQSLLKNVNRMQVYRMSAIDPESLVKLLNELGDLEPTTRLQVDKKNQSVIAYASLVDHMTIRMLVARLDGSERKFEVVRLRRLEADYVAGTIEFMMGGGDKKKQNNQFSPFFDYYPYGGRNNQQQEESKKFRVDADVENNRLLLYVNEIELAEIQNLLVKLGEMPAAGGNPSMMRVLESIDPAEADELLRRLKKTWPGVSPHPLQFGPGAESRADPLDEVDSDPAAPAKPAKRSKPQTTTDRRSPRSRAGDTAGPPEQEPAANGAVNQLLRLVQLKEQPLASEDEVAGDDGADDTAAGDDLVDDERSKSKTTSPTHETTDEPAEIDDDAAVEERVAPPAARQPASPSRRRPPAEAPAPIRIGRGPDGRLVIASDDPAALDQLEDLVSRLAPPRREYKVFVMKHKSTFAYSVAQNLKDFFEDKDKDKNTRTYDPYIGRFRSGGQTEDSGRRLSKRRPLKFITDFDSNSILVTGADSAQLTIIEDLIEMYDVPDSKDSQSSRITKVYQVRHSKARVIADALKEVYRDLLSINDPAMQQAQNNQKKDRPPEPQYTYVFNSGEPGDGKKPEAPIKFKGALSIGVDDLSNTLVISAGEGLLASVEDTIKTLDEAARPTVNRMQVLKLDRSIDVNEVQKRISKLLPKRPPPQPPQPGQQQLPQQPQREGPPGNGSTTIIEN